MDAEGGGAVKRLNPVMTLYLQVWGSCQRRDIGLGYPSITPEARLLHSPGRSTSPHKGPRYEPDVIDVAVSQAIEKIGPQHKNILIQRYVECQPRSFIAQSRGLTEWGCRRDIDKAIVELAKTLKINPYTK